MLEAAFPGFEESWFGRWLNWFVITFAGLAAGVVSATAASWAVAKVVGVPATQPAMLVLWAAVFGAVLGASQWYVLRLWVKGAGWWILATAVGFVVFEVAASGALEAAGWPASWPNLVDFGVEGLSLGLSQWLVLRRWVKRAGWWVLVTAVAWASSMALLFFPLGTFLYGAITGVAMMVLLAQESRH